MYIHTGCISSYYLSSYYHCVFSSFLLHQFLWAPTVTFFSCLLRHCRDLLPSLFKQCLSQTVLSQQSPQTEVSSIFSLERIKWKVKVESRQRHTVNIFCYIHLRIITDKRFNSKLLLKFCLERPFLTLPSTGQHILWGFLPAFDPELFPLNACVQIYRYFWQIS